MKVLLPVLLATAFLYIWTLRPGHVWGDDFAMYILHARNIAEGQPYLETGYIYNPQEPHMGPPAYPPLVPALLAPVIYLVGFNLQAMKIEIILLLLCALGVMFMLFSRFLSPSWSALLVLALAFNPNGYWASRNDIGSDIPFLLTLYTSLWLIQRSYSMERPSIGYAVIVGISVYLACSTRMLALVLFPSVVILEVLRRRTITRFALISLSCAILLIGLQGLLINTNAGYAGLFILRPAWILHTSIEYLRSLKDFWLVGSLPALSYLVYGIAGVLFVIGLFWRKETPISILEIFGALYFGLLTIYSVFGIFRYLYPLLPIYLLFVFSGLRWVIRNGGTLGKGTAVGIGILILILYGGQFWNAARGPIAEGIGDRNFIELCDYIKSGTSKTDIFIFRKPRLLALMTGRSASAYSEKGNVANHVGAIRATYVVVANVPSEDFASNRTSLQPYVTAASNRMRKVYENPEFSLYLIERD